MSVFVKTYFTDNIGPALYVALVLLMSTQLVIITALGVSFEGKRHPSLVAESASKEHKGNGKTAFKDKVKTASKDIGKTARMKSYGAPPLGESSPLIKNPTSWPPVEDRLYPDMELYNQNGKKTRLSALSGNVIIVQPVAMTCPLSQAYSGANKKGKTAFKLCFPTVGDKDLGQRMSEYTGLSMKTPGLVFVQILFYNMRNEPPSVEDARQWAEHFDLRISNNQYVLVATPEMVTRKSKMLIPGFQLIDRSFILRSDNTGLLPKRSLYNHFFPTLQNLLPQVSTSPKNVLPPAWNLFPQASDKQETLLPQVADNQDRAQ